MCHQWNLLPLATDFNHSTMTSGGLRVLTTDTDSPVVTETTMQLHFLHSLNVLTKALVQEVGILLACLAILDITLAIQHICRDLKLQRVTDDGHNLVDLICSQLPCALIHINVAFL